MGDKIDNIMESSIAAFIGIIMLCALVIPVAVQQIGGLTGDMANWNSMLYLVVTMCIVGLIIGVIRYFTGSSSKR